MNTQKITHSAIEMGHCYRKICIERFPKNAAISCWYCKFKFLLSFYFHTSDIYLVSQLCITTWKLFDALLDAPNCHVLHNLALRNLLGRGYVSMTAKAMTPIADDNDVHITGEQKSSADGDLGDIENGELPSLGLVSDGAERTIPAAEHTDCRGAVVAADDTEQISKNGGDACDASSSPVVATSDRLAQSRLLDEPDVIPTTVPTDRCPAFGYDHLEDRHESSADSLCSLPPSPISACDASSSVDDTTINNTVHACVDFSTASFSLIVNSCITVSEE